MALWSCSSAKLPLHLLSVQGFWHIPAPGLHIPPSLHLFVLPPSAPCLLIFTLSSYLVATAWVSPPEVRSWIRLPEAGRSTPVAQLKNILESARHSIKMIDNCSGDNCYNTFIIMFIVGIRRMVALPPRLFLFLYPHLFHLGLSDWIKRRLKPPNKI